jgi:hypothetical protein
MDPRIIYALASQPPEARIATAIRANIPLEALHQIEMVALANGIELVGGPATAVEGGGGGGGGGGGAGLGGGGGGGDEGAGAPPARWSDEMKVSLQVVRGGACGDRGAGAAAGCVLGFFPPPTTAPLVCFYAPRPSPSLSPLWCLSLRLRAPSAALGDDVVQGVELRRRCIFLPRHTLHAVPD